MPSPKCPDSKCPGRTFSMQEIVPVGSNYKVMAICCSVCGAVLSTEPYANTAAMLSKQNEALKLIAAALNIRVSL